MLSTLQFLGLGPLIRRKLTSQTVNWKPSVVIFFIGRQTILKHLNDNSTTKFESYQYYHLLSSFSHLWWQIELLILLKTFTLKTCFVTTCNKQKPLVISQNLGSKWTNQTWQIPWKFLKSVCFFTLCSYIVKKNYWSIYHSLSSDKIFMGFFWSDPNLIIVVTL